MVTGPYVFLSDSPQKFFSKRPGYAHPGFKTRLRIYKKFWFSFHFLGKLKLWAATANRPKASCLFRASDNLSENFRKNPRNVLRIQNMAGTDYGALTKSKQYFEKIDETNTWLAEFQVPSHFKRKFQEKMNLPLFSFKTILKVRMQENFSFYLCYFSK